MTMTAAPAPTSAPAPARITILLCTRNGAAHLSRQLASYLAQDDDAWDLWAFDDGSDDGTRDILRGFARDHGGDRAIRIGHGPQKGLAANFLSGLCHPDLPAGPVALSDQDDVWLPRKLGRARAMLAAALPGAPALYGAQCLRTRADLTPLTPSPAPVRPPAFANALVQNVVRGNTAVLSAAALDLVRRAGVPDGVPYHDWWLYQLVSGAGGPVIVDDAVVTLYRQHGGNAMGAHKGLIPALTRGKQLLDGTYGGWLAAGWTALRARAALLTPEARALLEDLMDSRPGPARAAALRRGGVHRQGAAGQAVLMTLARLGRI